MRPGAVLEALSYLGLALALASITAVRATFSRVARVPAAILVLGAVLVVFGQLGGGGRHTFPLVRFNVYTDEIGDDASDFTTYEGVRADGSRALLQGDHVFHSLENGRFGSFQSHLFSASGIGSGRATDGRHDAAVDDYRRFLLGVLRQYNAEHSDRPIVALDIVAHDAPDIPELAEHRADVTSQLLMTVRADGTFTIAPGAAGAPGAEQQVGAAA